MFFKRKKSDKTEMYKRALEELIAGDFMNVEYVLSILERYPILPTRTIAEELLFAGRKKRARELISKEPTVYLIYAFSQIYGRYDRKDLDKIKIGDMSIGDVQLLIDLGETELAKEVLRKKFNERYRGGLNVDVCIPLAAQIDESLADKMIAKVDELISKKRDSRIMKGLLKALILARRFDKVSDYLEKWSVEEIRNGLSTSREFNDVFEVRGYRWWDKSFSHRRLFNSNNVNALYSRAAYVFFTESYLDRYRAILTRKGIKKEEIEGTITDDIEIRFLPPDTYTLFGDYYEGTIDWDLYMAWEKFFFDRQAQLLEIDKNLRWGSLYHIGFDLPYAIMVSTYFDKPVPIPLAEFHVYSYLLYRKKSECPNFEVLEKSIKRILKLIEDNRKEIVDELFSEIWKGTLSIWNIFSRVSKMLDTQDLWVFDSYIKIYNINKNLEDDFVNVFVDILFELFSKLIEKLFDSIDREGLGEYETRLAELLKGLHEWCEYLLMRPNYLTMLLEKIINGILARWDRLKEESVWDTCRVCENIFEYLLKILLYGEQRATFFENMYRFKVCKEVLLKIDHIAMESIFTRLRSSELSLRDTIYPPFEEYYMLKSIEKMTGNKYQEIEGLLVKGKFSEFRRELCTIIAELDDSLPKKLLDECLNLLEKVEGNDKAKLKILQHIESDYYLYTYTIPIAMRLVSNIFGDHVLEELGRRVKAQTPIAAPPICTDEAEELIKPPEPQFGEEQHPIPQKEISDYAIELIFEQSGAISEGVWSKIPLRICSHSNVPIKARLILDGDVEYKCKKFEIPPGGETVVDLFVKPAAKGDLPVEIRIVDEAGDVLLEELVELDVE